MLQAVILFAIGLVLLIKGGDWFVDGAAGIAEDFHVPEILIGATVVSIGTTLPEVMVSTQSAISGHGEIAYGNAIGSVICNTALIAAVTVAIRPSVVEKKTLRKPVLYFFVAAIFYAAVAYVTGYYSRGVGLILLAVFLIYMVLTVKEAFGGKKADEDGDALAETEEKSEADATDNSMLKEIFLLIIGAAAIAVGANLLVDNGTIIAVSLGVPESVIALTIVALGTSLPELVTAITSLAKGHSDMSLGNICGANLFNLVLVSGVACTVGPYQIPVEKTVTIGGQVINASLVVDLPIMLLVMALLTIPPMITGKLKRWVGILLLCIYIAFCTFQFMG